MRAKYVALDKRLVALNREQGQRAPLESADEQAVKAQMVRLAVGAKLRGCTETAGGVSCDGRGIGDAWILLFYYAGGLAAVFSLFIWVGAVYSTSWLLPYRNPSLWYTPLYGAAIALLTVGPLLMATLYLNRANADYSLPVARSSMPTPSVLLYVLIVLQVTVVTVALVKARTPFMSISRRIGGPVVAILASAYAALLLSGTIWLISCAVILSVGLVLGSVRAILTESANARGLEHGPPRILQLSAVLIIAWILFAADIVLSADGVLHDVLTALCLVACAAHVLVSHALELSYGLRQVSGPSTSVAP